MANPCQRCGACCAHYRVSFYWSEADPAAGGHVLPELTEPLNPYRSAMRGTLRAPVRCIALTGEVGGAVACTIYDRRASTCRSVQAGDEQCLKARAAYRLPCLDAAARKTDEHTA